MKLPETDGLVRGDEHTPMLQPYEVYDQELFDVEMVRVFGRSWVWLGDTEDLKEPGDFFTGGILLALERLDFQDPGPAPFVEGGQLGERRVGLQAAILQSDTNLVRVFPYEGRIQHSRILY